MKIGMITDSLGNLGFDAMLKASAELGLETLEFACGNWSSAPHLKLDRMLESAQARGLTVFWAHRLDEMVEWIGHTRA